MTCSWVFGGILLFWGTVVWFHITPVLSKLLCVFGVTLPGACCISGVGCRASSQVAVDIAGLVIALLRTLGLLSQGGHPLWGQECVVELGSCCPLLLYERCQLICSWPARLLCAQRCWPLGLRVPSGASSQAWCSQHRNAAATAVLWALSALFGELL